MPQESQMDENLQAKPIEVPFIASPLEDRVAGGRLPQRRRFGVSHVALAALFGVFLIVAGGVGSALAADDDDDDEPFDKKLFSKFMHTLGFVNGTEPGFNYQARPPLVVPPTRNLPPPETTGAITARNPAWPVDLDEARRKAEKKARSQRRSNIQADYYQYEQPLSPSEIAAGKTGKPTDPNSLNQPDYLHNPQSPGELGFTNGMFKDLFGLGKVFTNEPEYGSFLREPPRVSLTDPPPGYRTPSPEQPYGARLKGDVEKKTVRERQLEGMGQ